MLRHSITYAFRQLKNNKLLTGSNTIGFVAFIKIMLIVIVLNGIVLNSIYCQAQAKPRESTLLGETNLTDHQADDRHPAWSPNGRQLVFESNRSGKWGIYRMSARGNNQHCLVCDEFDNRTPSFHPDGSRILFESNRTGTWLLYSFELKTFSIAQVIDAHLFNGPQQWGSYAPNGRWVVFTSTLQKDNFNLFLFEIATPKIIQLTYDSTRSLYPVWSFDSKYIAFFSRKETHGKDDDIYTYEVATGECKRITNDPLNQFSPGWLPSGDLVFVSSLEKKRPELFLMNKKTRQWHQLTFNDDGDTEPAASPDGKNLAWTGFRNGQNEILTSRLKRIR